MNSLQLGYFRICAVLAYVSFANEMSSPVDWVLRCCIRLLIASSRTNKHHEDNRLSVKIFIFAILYAFSISDIDVDDGVGIDDDDDDDGDYNDDNVTSPPTSSPS